MEQSMPVKNINYIHLYEYNWSQFWRKTLGKLVFRYNKAGIQAEMFFYDKLLFNMSHI